MADPPLTGGAIASGDRVDERPEPLTHPECDLRDFQYMPFDVRRVRDSETAVLLNGEEFRAAFLLWCAAWHQVPAGSLPKDDRLLATLAGVGGSTRKWSAVRKGALRGFIECRDGRLYHPVVCEKVIQAVAKRSEQRSKTTAARAALALKRAGTTDEHTGKDSNINKSPVCDSDSTEDGTAAVKGGFTVPKGREGNRRKGNGDKNGGGVVTRDGRAKAGEQIDSPKGAEQALLVGNLIKQFKDAYRGPVSKVAEGKFRSLLATGENADPIIAAASRAIPEMPAEQWLDERGWAQLSFLPPAKSKSPLISPEAEEIARAIAEIAGQKWDFLEPGWCGAAMRCQMWLSEGWPRELIVAGVRATVTARAPEKISNVAYFDKPLARFIAQQTRPVPSVIELEAQTVEVNRGKTAVRHDPRSGYAAIDRIYDRIEEIQLGDRADMPKAGVQRLPS